jgi:ABC-type uncharacterized transport system substrate-binding protein
MGSGDDRRIRALAAEIVQLAPDVIVCAGSQVARAVKQETNSIPIVFVNVADPIDTGLVANWHHPGGNATGFAAWELTIGEKWLQLLKEIAQGLARVLVLFDPDNPSAKRHLQTLERSAQLQTISLTEGRVGRPAEIAPAIERFAREPNSGMIVLPSGFTQKNRSLIIEQAARFRSPAIYPYRYQAIDGGLVSFGTDPLDIFRRAADYVDRILRGANPGDLPAQAPTKFQLVINLKTGNALGLEIPPTLLSRADEVIE